MPTVSTLPFIKPHFHSNAGTPATGYKLYSYDATTQDEYPLYKDPAGTIEYTNPIILNSRGEPDGAGIYLDDDKVYKLILKTETNDLVWTVNAVQGVGGNGGIAVPVIPLPGHTVLGNATDIYGDAYAVEIVDNITDTTDINVIPSVGAVKTLTDGYLPKSGNNTYNGNLTVSGDINASNISVNGTDIDDIYVAKDGHNARSLVGNIDSEAGAVEDIAIADTLASGSANEIPSVAAVKTYVDDAVSGLESAISTAGDGTVAIQAGDSKGYIDDKLIVAGAIDKATVGTPSNKYLQLIGTGEVSVSNTDSVGFLEDKIIAGDNVSITVDDEGTTYEKLKISAVLPESTHLYAGKVSRYQTDIDFTNISGTYSQVFYVGALSSNWVYSGSDITDMTEDGSFLANYNSTDGIYTLSKEGIYNVVFSAHAFLVSGTSYPCYFNCAILSSYDDFVTSTIENSMQLTLETPMVYQDNMDNLTISALINNSIDGLGRLKKFKVYVTAVAFSGTHRCIATFRNSYISIVECAKPVTGPQGPKGDQGDPGVVPSLDSIHDVDVTGATDGQVLTYDLNTATWIPTTVSGGTIDATLDGLQSYALIMTNSSISTGHTSDQGSTYTSARVIPAANVEANYISCFATQIGTYYGLRMGIYTPGPAGDTLIAQTANLTTTPSTGIITLPLLYDAAGNVLTSPITLDPNTSYMLAAVIKANACNFASYTGISTNPPNHFGRKEDWNAPAPTNLMQTTASYSQTNQFIWMSVSR